MTFSPDISPVLTPTLSPDKIKLLDINVDINDICKFKTTEKRHLKRYLSSNIINIRFEKGIVATLSPNKNNLAKSFANINL